MRWKRLLWSGVALAVIFASLLYVVWVEMRHTEPPEVNARGPAHDAPVTLIDTPAAGPAGSDRVIKIGWTAWADAEIVTRLVARILEEHFDRKVELLMSDIGIQYQGVAAGDLDVMLMAWLPTTHAAFYGRVSQDVVDLGPIYSQARIGWVVPRYVPEGELSSLEDLRRPAVVRRLSGAVQGIDPGSGLMQASERALDVYGLEQLSVVSASGAAMTAALDRAIRKQEWIVVTAWNPHWMFARFDLRYLDDPKGVFGGEERVHALVSRRFARDGGSEENDFLTRLFIPRSELEHAMLEAAEQDADIAATRYLERHADRVRYWVTGAVEPIGAE